MKATWAIIGMALTMTFAAGATNLPSEMKTKSENFVVAKSNANHSGKAMKTTHPAKHHRNTKVNKK